MKAGRRQEYQDILNEMVSEEEIIATKLLTATFIETFGMTEEQLIQTHMHYMSDPKRPEHTDAVHGDAQPA